MHRRDVLRVVGGTSLTGLAGCTDLFKTRSARSPPVSENRPDAVYAFQRHNVRSQITKDEYLSYGWLYGVPC